MPHSHDRYHDLMDSLSGLVFVNDDNPDEFAIYDGLLPVFVTFDAERDEIGFTAHAFLAKEAPELLAAQPIADFNGYHLLHGGYSLIADRKQECIWLRQTKALARVEEMSLDAFMQEFIACRASCATWYAAQIETDGLPPSPADADAIMA